MIVDYIWPFVGLAAFGVTLRYIRTKKAVDAANLFYINVKPCLERLGFDGEPGSCTEQIDFVDNLYYLRAPERAEVFSDLWPEMLRRYFAEDYWLSDDEEPVGNLFTISFTAEITSLSNMGVMCLDVIGRRGSLEHGKYGKTLTKVAAPISYFNRSNVLSVMRRFRMDIDACNNGEEWNELWLIDGIQDKAKSQEVCGLPYIYPDKEEKKSRRLKTALKFLRYGYPN